MRLSGNIIFMATALFAFVFCEEAASDVVSLSVCHSKTGSEKNSQLVSVKVADGQAWTISVRDNNGLEAEWASVYPVSGTGPAASVTLALGKNDSGASRTVVLTLCSGGRQDTVSVVQAPESATEIQADEPQNWLELPAMERGNSLYFITKQMRLGNETVRNYSYCWDSRALVAHWVAYPLNRQLMGSGSRTDAWGSDMEPNIESKIPESMQPMLYKGYRSSNKNRYDRGHQCPSADRLASFAINATTFCYTNVTPQLDKFNQNIWAALETHVRRWSYSFDTLYVVTGCTVDDSKEYAYDNVGASVRIPTAYYKALLGYKADNTIGISGSTKGFTAIAFYFEHRAYSNDNYFNEAITVDELEKRVGIDFFVNLEELVGKECYEKVESSRDRWWWNN